MNDETEDTIDALLRDQFEGPVPVGTFCDRVMERLPTRPRRTMWPVAGGALTGAAACGLSLWASPITHAGFRDWLSGQVSASAIVLVATMTSMALLALAWTIAEADDRNGSARARLSTIRSER
jgi:hypothetical protein